MPHGLQYSQHVQLHFKLQSVNTSHGRMCTWLGHLQQGVLQCVCSEVLFCAQRSFAHGV